MYNQGSMFHPLQPYGNIYGTPGIIPFDPGVVPVSPFGVPSYMPSFYGGMNNPQEYDCDSSSDDYHDEGGRRTSHMQYQTEKRSERYGDEGSRRVEKRYSKDMFFSPTSKKPCYSSNEQLLDQKHRKEFDSYGRERRKHYSERSASELHDMPDNSIQDTKQRRKQHHRSAPGKRYESREKHKSDYSEYTHHQSRKEKSHADRADDGHKSSKNTHRHKHWDHETDHLTDYKRDSKVKASSQSSRHAKTKVGSSDGYLGSDRWEMGDGHPDNYERRDHYRHKRKGIH